MITKKELQTIIESAISKYKKDSKPNKADRKYVTIKQFGEQTI
jgi:hypothetical protein